MGRWNRERACVLRAGCGWVGGRGWGWVGFTGAARSDVPRKPRRAAAGSQTRRGNPS